MNSVERVKTTLKITSPTVFRCRDKMMPGKMTYIRLSLLFCVLSCAHVQAGAAEKPNVLIILTDDQGYGDLSLHGNRYIRTPNMDGLGKSGVRFDRFYVSTVCAPSRAALLTGRWPLRTGCHGVTHNRETMRTDEVTIAEAFAEAGYRTACIGKWHNGAHYPYTPAGQGFEHFFGFTAGHWNNYFNPVLQRNGSAEKTAGYITDVLTDEAMHYIAASDGRPFLCLLAYNAPHSPFQVPDSYFDRFQKNGYDDRTSAFWGMVENLDDNIGRLLKLLKEKGLEENTLVLFLSDNGATAGIKHFNAGMRGGKTSVHEGGSRVPLFMRWPVAKWKPHVVTELTAHIDIYPTILDLCRIPAPQGPRVDGVSLRPLLEMSGPAAPDRILFIHNGIDETNKWPGAVRTGEYRLVRKIKGPAAGSSAVNADHTAGPWELYDMTDDPGEKHNLAEEKPETVAKLSALYDNWLAEISSPPLSRPPIPIGYSRQNPVDLPAHYARIQPPLKYASGGGFAHDWLTGWTSADGCIEFVVDAQRSGMYSAEIAYGCSSENAGSRVRISAGDSTLEVKVPAAPAPEIKLPHRDKTGPEKYRNRKWAVLKAGAMHIPAGRCLVTVKALSIPGNEVMDFKHLRMTYMKE